MVGAGGEESEQHERLVEGDILVVGAFEPARSVTIGADHVVVDQQMSEAELLRTFGVGADRTRVVADLVMRDDCSDLHGAIAITPAVRPPISWSAAERRARRSTLRATARAVVRS